MSRVARKGHVRPRYDRIAALVLAAGVTGFALLSGLGLLASGPGSAPVFATVSQHGALREVLDTPQPRPATASAHRSPPARAGLAARNATAGLDEPSVEPSDEALPADSGTGRRVVFDMSSQRVWLVDTDNTLLRSYPVSGSVSDNLHPGSYSVYSRSRYAVGISDSGVMQYFVRFTRGNNAAIGFHSIPTQNGQPLQTLDQLGTPQSHGCIRQALPDAIALWDFAPDGTAVDVVA